MHMFGIKFIFCFAVLCVFDLSAGLASLPKVEENDIVKTESVIRKTTNAIFCSLKLRNIRNQTSINQFSLIHNYFISLTLQDYNSLKEIAKLTRVVKTDIENVTTNFIALINEIQDEENIVQLETVLMEEDIGPRYDIESEIEKLMYLKKMHVDNRNKIMDINKDVLKILQDHKTLDLNVSTTLTDPQDYSDENILDENIFWHGPDRLLGGRRIYDGQRTKIKHYPFMASIQIFNKFQCAGCIIKSDLVITAASCLQLAWNNRFYRENPPFLSVRVGSSFYEFGGEKIGVHEVYFNPEYNPKNLHNNIALVRLERKIKLSKKNKKVKKIYLDKIDHKLPSTVGIIEILGWGATSLSNKLHGPFDDKLKHAILHVYPHSECQELYSKEFVTKNNFCGGYISKGTGACNRDLGGPGLVSGILTGIISFGAPSCGTPDAPTVFTKLGFYNDWIEEIMEQDVPVFKKKTTLKPVMWTYPPTYIDPTNWHLLPPSTKGLLRSLTFKTNETITPLSGMSKNKIKNVDKDTFKDYLKTVFESDEKNNYLEITNFNENYITTNTTQGQTFSNNFLSIGIDQPIKEDPRPSKLLPVDKIPLVKANHDNYSNNKLVDYTTTENQSLPSNLRDTQKVLPVEEIQNQIQQLDKVVAQEKENREIYIEHQLRQIIDDTNDKKHVRTEMLSGNTELSNGTKLIMQSLSVTTGKQKDTNETPHHKKDKREERPQYISGTSNKINEQDKEIILQENKKLNIMQIFSNPRLNDGEKYDLVMKLVKSQDMDELNINKNIIFNQVPASDENFKQLLVDKKMNDNKKHGLNISDSLVAYKKVQDKNLQNNEKYDSIIQQLMNSVPSLAYGDNLNKGVQHRILQVVDPENSQENLNNIFNIVTDKSLKDKEKYIFIMQLLAMPNVQIKYNEAEKENNVTQEFVDVPMEIARIIQNNIKESQKQKNGHKENFSNYQSKNYNIEPTADVILEKQSEIPFNYDNGLKIRKLDESVTPEVSIRLLLNDQQQMLRTDAQDTIENTIKIDQLSNNIKKLSKMAIAEEKQFMQTGAEDSEQLLLTDKDKNELDNQIDFAVQTPPILYYDVDSAKNESLFTQEERELYKHILRVSNDPKLNDSQKEDVILASLDRLKTDITTKRIPFSKKDNLESNLENSVNMVLRNPVLNEQQKYDYVMRLVGTDEKYLSTDINKPLEFSTLSSIPELKNMEPETEPLRSDPLEVLRSKEIIATNDGKNLVQNGPTFFGESVKSKVDSMLEYVLSIKPKIIKSNTPLQNNITDSLIEPTDDPQNDLGIHSYTARLQETSMGNLLNLHGNHDATKNNKITQEPFSDKYSQLIAEKSIIPEDDYQNLLDSLSQLPTGLILDNNLQQINNPLQIDLVNDKKASNFNKYSQQPINNQLQESIFDKISQSLAETPKYALDETQGRLNKPISNDMLTPEISGIANNFKDIKTNLETVFSLLKSHGPGYKTENNINSFLKLHDFSTTTKRNFEFISYKPFFRAEDQKQYKSNFYQETREGTPVTKSINNTVMNFYGKLFENKDIVNNKIKKIVASLLNNKEEEDESDIIKTKQMSYKNLLQNDDLSRTKITKILLSLISEKKEDGKRDSSIIEAYSNLIKNDDVIKNKISRILTSLLSDNNSNWKKMLKVENADISSTVQGRDLKNIDNIVKKRNTLAENEYYSFITPSSTLVQQNTLDDVDLRILKLFNDPYVNNQENVNTPSQILHKISNTMPGKHDLLTTWSSSIKVKPQRILNETTQDLSMTTKTNYKEIHNVTHGIQNELNLSMLLPLPLISQDSNVKALDGRLDSANNLSSTPKQVIENTLRITVHEKGPPFTEISFSPPTQRKGTFQNIAYGFYGMLSNSVNKLTSVIGLKDTHHINLVNTTHHTKEKNKGVLRHISDRLFGVPDGPKEEMSNAKSSLSVDTETKTTNSKPEITKKLKGCSMHVPENKLDKRHEKKNLSFTTPLSQHDEQEKDLKNIADQVFKILGNPEMKKEEKQRAMLQFASAVEATEKYQALRSVSIPDLDMRSNDNNKEENLYQDPLKLDTSLNKAILDGNGNIERTNKFNEVINTYIIDTTSMSPIDDNFDTHVKYSSNLDFDNLNKEIDKNLNEWKMQHKEI